MLSSLFALLLQPGPALPTPPEPTLTVAQLPSDHQSETALTLPAGTPILIVIEKELGSRESQAGEFFPIHLAQPVLVDGVEVLPAGITGQGQVVHAKKAGISGAAGELVLAARYLDHGGHRIELRSFRFLEARDVALSKGQDNIGVASAATVFAGPLGLLIGGGNTRILPGTVASAKTRNEEIFAPTN